MFNSLKLPKMEEARDMSTNAGSRTRIVICYFSSYGSLILMLKIDIETTFRISFLSTIIFYKLSIFQSLDLSLQQTLKFNFTDFLSKCLP